MRWCICPRHQNPSSQSQCYKVNVKALITLSTILNTWALPWSRFTQCMNLKTKSYKELTISFWVNEVIRKNMIEVGNTLKSIRSSFWKICAVKSKSWIVSLSSYIESIVVGERIICFASRSREIETTLIVTKRKPNVKTAHLPPMHVICITLAKKMYSVK